MAFEVLWLDGRDLRRLPLIERKAMPRRIVRNNDRVRYVEHIEGRGVEFFRAACKMSIDSIVAKWRHGICRVGWRNNQLADDQKSALLANGRSEQLAARAEGQVLRAVDTNPTVIRVS